MIIKIVAVIVVLLSAFLIYVAQKPNEFHYEKSENITAPPEKIFPYLSQLKLGSQWNPFDQKDPHLKRNFMGTDGQVGSIMEFDGNSDAGAGKLEITKVLPNEFVEIRLSMTKPMAGESVIEYKITPSPSGSLVTWGMSGKSPFIGKLFCVFIDMQKMMEGQFTDGLTQLKKIVETK